MPSICQAGSKHPRFRHPFPTLGDSYYHPPVSQARVLGHRRVTGIITDLTGLSLCLWELSQETFCESSVFLCELEATTYGEQHFVLPSLQVHGVERQLSDFPLRGHVCGLIKQYWQVGQARGPILPLQGVGS